MMEVGSRSELKILLGVLFNYHNANSTLIEKLLKLMDWRKKFMKSQRVYIETRGELPSLRRGKLERARLCEPIARRPDLEGQPKRRGISSERRPRLSPI